MILLKIAVLLAASLVAADAAGQQEAPAPAPASASPASAKAGADKPAAPKKPPVKRRAVHQIVDGMPAYGPRLNAPPAVPVSPQPAPPGSVVPPVSAPAAPSPGLAPPPAVIGQCDAGGCTDVNGTRYNGAAGSTVIGPQGRSCTTNGGIVQCF